MQTLIKSLKEQGRRHGSQDYSDSHPLQVASRAWAEHCVNTYQGKLLKRGLSISAAISDFTSELLIQNRAVFDADCDAKDLD